MDRGYSIELSVRNSEPFNYCWSCFVSWTVEADGVLVVEEEIGCLGVRDQARLEDAWPAEAPSYEGRSVGSENANAQHTFVFDAT